MKKSTWFPLALSGLFFGAEKLAESHGAGTAIGPILAGSAVIANGIGSYLNNLAAAQTDKKLNEAERLRLASKNHHLRRSMTRAVRRGLTVARDEIVGLDMVRYQALFACWDSALDKAESDDEMLDHILPPLSAEPHWQATNNYRENIDEHSRALASVLRRSLISDHGLSAGWPAAEAMSFAKRTLPYYRQAFADEIALDRDGFSFHAFVVKALQEHGEKLDRVLEAIQHEQQQSRTRAYALPLLGLFVGRDAELAVARDRWLQDRSRPLLIHGPPGIGKSKLALALLHDDLVVRKFGRMRYQLRCDAFKTAKDVVAAMGLEWFGWTPSETIEGEVVAELKRGECAIVIDNFETPYRADTAACDTLLQRLLGVEELWLIVGVQGSDSPIGLRWAEPIQPQRLGFEDASRLFCEISRNPSHARDPLLRGLLNELDGVPHAIQLLAAQAEGEENLQGLAIRWRKEKTKLLQRGGDHTRETDIEAAYEFAIASPALEGGPRQLLRILACLPAGFPEGDIEQILVSDTLFRTLKEVKRAALVFKEVGRLRMLAPLREYVLRAHEASTAELALAHGYFLEIAVRGNELGGTGSNEIIKRFTNEYANVQWAVDWAITNSDPRAINAALGLAQFIRFRGLRDWDVLQRAQNLARARGDVLGDAQCGALLARIALTRNQYEDAHRDAEASRQHYVAAGDRLGEADCIRTLAIVALRRDELVDAVRYTQNAADLYRELNNLRGQADCLVDFAEIARRKDELDEAVRLAQEALSMYHKAGNELGRANSLSTLWLVAWQKSQTDESLLPLREALSIYRDIGFKKSEAWCVAQLARVAVSASQHEQAREQFQEALMIYRELGDRSNEGFCVDSLGRNALDASQYDEARSWFQAGLAIFHESDDRRSEAWCMNNLGRNAMSAGRYDEARQWFQSGLALFREIVDRPGEADCIRFLGNIAQLQKQYQEARLLYDQALATYRVLDDAGGQGECLGALTSLSNYFADYAAPDELMAEGAAAITSALLRAVERVDEERVELLLTAGVSARLASESGRTALHMAASSGGGTASTSIPIGVRGSHPDQSPPTVRGDMKQIVLSLLDHGGAIDQKDNEGRTPLHIACARDCAEIALCLLSHGADPKIEDGIGLLPLLLAAQSASEETVRALLDAGVSPNCVNSRGFTALAIASRAGMQSIIKLLLEKGADPNYPTVHGIVPLIQATQMRHEKVIGLLCEAGALVDATDARGMSALMYASWFACDTIVGELIRWRADSSIRGPGGWTPLMFAADAIRRGRNLPGAKRTVQLLMEAGASPEKIDNSGRDALAISQLQDSGDSWLISTLSHRSIGGV
jgi:ankyrin repeat protein/tetratricopeptide (TPR) repeat protein